jgi:hypothetical protein
VSPGRRMDELRSSRHLGALKKRTRDREPTLARRENKRSAGKTVPAGRDLPAPSRA